MKIEPDKLRLDGGTQPREKLDESIIAEYSGKMRAGIVFPPPVAFYDGTSYWLADGFHRTHAAIRASIKRIDVDVRMGNLRDAILCSCSANAAHGLRRSNADKRRAVLTLLNDEEWGQWSDSKIAARCGVDDKTVARYRPESISGISEDAAIRKAVRNGREYTIDTSRIGKAVEVIPGVEVGSVTEVSSDSEAVAAPEVAPVAEMVTPAEVAPAPGSVQLVASHQEPVRLDCNDLAMKRWVELEGVIRGAFETWPESLRGLYARRLMRRLTELSKELIAQYPEPVNASETESADMESREMESAFH